MSSFPKLKELSFLVLDSNQEIKLLNFWLVRRLRILKFGTIVTNQSGSKINNILLSQKFRKKTLNQVVYIS